MSRAASDRADESLEVGYAARSDPAEWLALAAAPTFAAMTLVTGLLGDPMALCSAGPEGSPLAGMAFMYLLMSAFHVPAWLKLGARRRNSGRPRGEPVGDGGEVRAGRNR